MKYRTVIFDFDGTIADTQQIAFDAANELAREFGFAPIRADEIPHIKKMSARELLVTRLHVPLWNIWKIYRLEKRGRELFAARVAEVRAFPGMKEVIEGLRRAGCRVGVVSSNSEEVVAKVLQRTTIPVDFVHAGSGFFGKARAIRQTFKLYDVDRSHAVYVGDELRDIEACKKAGIDMVAVGWGFNSSDALRAASARVVRTPRELSDFLQQ